jgi:splicing factor 3A subunit 1
MQPAKRARTDDGLLNEEEFAKQHTGQVTITVRVPNEPDQAQWKLQGQSVSLQCDVRASMKMLKQQLSSALGGIPASKQQLKHPILGFMKDNFTLAHYNIADGASVELKLKQRGGRR